eukprot:107541-Ditylum_brightwellii.AAC.1
MGGGQHDLALNMLHDAVSKGHWLCLKNLHLVIDWLPVLGKELRNLQTTHDDFRLWLTTEQHANFPKTLIEGSIKV